MYEKTDKKKLYDLIDMYLSGGIDESIFCSAFCSLYDLEIDYRTLTENEHKAFSELGEVVGRFSEFEDDHEKYPNVYYTKKELNTKIQEIQSKLKN